MSDLYPMLLTRAHPKREIQDAFDDWQREKHLPDLMRAPGATMVVYARNVLDGLPEAYKGSGSCLAYYEAPTVEDLFAFLTSTEIAEAVADGSRWFGRFNDVDYETYTGNVYQVTGVVNPAGGPPPETSPLLVERWEAPDDDLDVFDEWLGEAHLPELGSAAGVRRARSFSAIREGIPIPYYYSPGNRALVAELDDDFRGLLLQPELLERLEESMRWERRLPYVKRDVYEHVAHARSTR
jgi:hypothetical protein